jgi:hypothetical protein
MTFAQRINLLPGDVVITNKKFLNLVDHYLVYLGVNNYGQEVYIENDYRNGVQCITGDEFTNKNPTWSAVRKLNGDDTQRYWACERAKSLLYARYDLQRFNCENFANYVQYGQSFSSQVNTANNKFLGWVTLGIATKIQRVLS